MLSIKSITLEQQNKSLRNPQVLKLKRLDSLLVAIKCLASLVCLHTNNYLHEYKFARKWKSV